MSRENGRKRRQFTAEEKAVILRRHLADKVPVSDLCEEYHLEPGLFYLWQRQVFDNLAGALGDGRSRRGQQQSLAKEQARISALEGRLARKDAVIAEISEEHLALKKKLGEG